MSTGREKFLIKPQDLYDRVMSRLRNDIKDNYSAKHSLALYLKGDSSTFSFILMDHMLKLFPQMPKDICSEFDVVSINITCKENLIDIKFGTNYGKFISHQVKIPLASSRRLVADNSLKIDLISLFPKSVNFLLECEA